MSRRLRVHWGADVTRAGELKLYGHEIVFYGLSVGDYGFGVLFYRRLVPTEIMEGDDHG